MPAAVMIETVAEPCATRKATAITYTTTSGESAEESSSFPAYSPTPESTMICLKAPPPPMITSSVPTGASDSVAIRAT